ncbi:MAG: Na+/H+ antiporter NhaC [Planctomycetota bacterium]|jgi:Na+/H+ antiporter NhaC
MSRAIPLVVFALLVLGLFQIPGASSEKLAAFHVGALLSSPAGTLAGEPEPEDVPSLLATLLDSPATVWDEAHEVADVRIGGVRMETPDATEIDLMVHEESRQSIIRALRAYAGDKGFQLSDRSLSTPDKDGAAFEVRLSDGKLAVGMTTTRAMTEFEETTYTVQRSWSAPNQWNLLPPLIAIFFAILLRKPVISLLAGVVLGAVLVPWLSGSGMAEALMLGLQSVPMKYLADQLQDNERTYLILFVVFMLAMVGVITRAGGIRGMMDRLSRYAEGARASQTTTWIMGLAIFFDDYANTILVGTTMRPLMDKAKVSREKLAYIVDSTAAPVAGISIFSTWIAFEVSTFSSSLPDAGIAASEGYGIFLQTLPYRFYCLLTLFFVALVTMSGRDFGPMLKAECRARGGKLLADGATPLGGGNDADLEAAPGVTPLARVALIPLATFLFSTLYMILQSGGAFAAGVDLTSSEAWTQILYNGSGAYPLMVGSAAGLIIAVILARTRGLDPAAIVSAGWSSLRSMGVAILILYLAWMIGGVCKELGTAGYLAVLLGDSIPDIVLPVMLFILSAAVAFSTGSSWSTMSILLPLVVGLSFRLGSNGSVGGELLMVMSIGAVLEGAIFGDHCSPISDTTVMSSIASGSDHIDHVRTQAPYAALTMLVALLIGYFPAAFFAGDIGKALPFMCLALGALALVFVLFTRGKKATAEMFSTQ